MLDIILDTIIDGIKILPFLWIAFLLIELVEHKYSKKTQKVMQKADRFGPFLGGILGCFPQCGFSVMATNLYITGMITLGTLISIYLSTSDEMLPILLAHGCKMALILKILGIKVVIGIISGFIIDLLWKSDFTLHAHDLCQEEHCHCENGIFLSSIKHTIHTLIFIMGVSLVLNIIMGYGGEDFLKDVIDKNSLFAPFLTSLIGLIPNCAASVIITELFLNEIIPFSCVIAGLLTGSGVAILVLFRANKNMKENIKILFIVYFIGVLSGILLELLSYFF